MSFEVDDAKYPQILKINGLDEGASPPKMVDISLFNKETAKIETWYLSRVERTSFRQSSIYRMHFGEVRAGLEIDDRSTYTPYMDWEHGTAGWLDEDMAFNLFDTVVDKPNLVIWPASCNGSTNAAARLMELRFVLRLG